MTHTPLLTTLTTLSTPHKSLGIVQGYAQDQLGLGNRIGASLGNFFGGSSSLTQGIGEKFVQLKQKALEALQAQAQQKYASCDCIAGIQFELLTMDINQGQDTMLVCNVTGTPVEFVGGSGRHHSSSHTRKSKRRRSLS